MPLWIYEPKMHAKMDHTNNTLKSYTKNALKAPNFYKTRLKT